MNRHKDLGWAEVQAKLDPEHSGKKLWSLNEMEQTGGEPDVVNMMVRRANIFFMIVRRKVLKAAEAFVTTVKDWSKKT